MTFTELRYHLYKIIQGYFNGATVMWAEQNSVKPTLPFVRLRLSTLRRPQHFIKREENDAPVSYIPSTTRLTVDLFTHGKREVDNDGNAYFVNTAVSDMADFANFLVSPYADDLYEELNISIRADGDVKDTSAVVDSNYEYRAMMEFVVDFMQESQGYAGISRENWSATPSGGGTEELANKQIQSVDFNEINIEEIMEE